MEFATSHDPIDWLPYIEALILSNRFQVSLGHVIFRLLVSKSRWTEVSLFLKLMRRSRFEHPSLAEKECKWVWASGFREHALKMVHDANIRWKTPRLMSLEGAMKEKLRDETSEERTYRNEYTREMPPDDLPFIVNE